LCWLVGLPPAQVREGEVVLVHAGASGVGTAAVQLARLAGAVPVVTAGSAEKVQMAVELGAAAGFDYNQQDFADEVLGFTGGMVGDLIIRKSESVFLVPGRPL